MEITVTEADEAVPAHTYISVRYGEQRRQAPFKQGEKFSFPVFTEKSYTVDVFRKVASKEISVAGITALGGTVKSEKVELPSLEIQGSPINVSMIAAVAKEGEIGLGLHKSALKKEEAAERMKKYMEKHEIQAVMQDMFAKLVESLPSDPLLFCVDYLEERRWENDPDHQERCFAEEPGLGDYPLAGFMPGDELPDLQQHHSLVADALRNGPDLYQRFRSEATSLGVSVAECIKPGIDFKGHGLVKVAGLFAGDAECYDLFGDLFTPIIKDLHSGSALGDTERHPFDMTPQKLSNARIDPTGQYAVHSLLEVRRNVQGLRFLSCCSKEERREVERLLTQAMSRLRKDLHGVYLPLASSQSHADKVGGMTRHQEQRLIKAGVLFAAPDSRLRLAAGFGRHWPDARGIFVSDTQLLHMWCNEEDHLRCFARQQDGEVKAMWSRMSRALSHIEASLSSSDRKFAWHNRLGYLTSCPSRLGTGIRATVALKIPHCAAKLDLPMLCRAQGLQPSQEVSSAAHGSVWNISNMDILGISEVDLMNTLIEGCAALVSAEQRLERGEFVYDIIPGLGSSALPGFPDRVCPSKLPDMTSFQSVAARVLRKTPAVWSTLRTKQTEHGVSLAACVKPAMDDPKMVSSGLVAGDAECYTTFDELFSPVIQELHHCGPESGKALQQQPVDVNAAKLSNTQMDPSGSHVQRVRVEVRRNLTGRAFSPCCDVAGRREVEQTIVKSLKDIAAIGGTKGEYLPLAGSTSITLEEGVDGQRERQLLEADGVLFGEPVLPVQLSGGIGRHWPDGRGVYRTDARDCYLWLNEEDHLRILAVQSGSNIKAAFSRAIGFTDEVLKSLAEVDIGFCSTSSLGFLTVRPEAIGCAMAVELTLSLPRLCARSDFGAICEALDFSWSMRAGKCLVSNISSLGLSEVDLANSIIEGCATLVTLEESLERGRAIESELKRIGVEK
mmetsp:Transcript_16749/g.38712  ORF Transcript_16749/g.38712 Transcript_16749/m.38712 type:complete len:956 (+) Transcript_16749:55-2922(+)